MCRGWSLTILHFVFCESYFVNSASLLTTSGYTIAERDKQISTGLVNSHIYVPLKLFNNGVEHAVQENMGFLSNDIIRLPTLSSLLYPGSSAVRSIYRLVC